MIGFFSRAIVWFNSQGIVFRLVMSDNGFAYFSKAFAVLCRNLGPRNIRTRPYTLRTNGKAERFIQTLFKDWAYVMPSRTQKNGFDGLPAILRSITASGSTRPSAVAPLSSGSPSCSADEIGESQQASADAGRTR